MYVILSVYLSKIIIHLFAGMSVRLYGSVYLTSVYLSVRLSVRILSICLSVCLLRERESNMDIVTFLHDIQINGDCDLSIYLSVSLTLSIRLTI